MVGHGHGTYKHFSRNTFGANDHTVDFAEGGGPPKAKVLRLRDMSWAVRELEIQMLEEVPNMRKAELKVAGDIVEWVVPPGVSSVVIDACGAQGGGASHRGEPVPSQSGGFGARVVCQAPVQAGERLRVLVGAAGETGVHGGGGGGGTFVLRATSPAVPLAIAGGGGGAGAASDGGPASLEEIGGDGIGNNANSGGRRGGGGQGDGSDGAGGSGGGLAGDGEMRGSEGAHKIGRSFLHGGAGGRKGAGGHSAEHYANGGFGGGGGSGARGGGGGGYSGGGGGGGPPNKGGGGGGSLNADDARGFADVRKEGGDGRVTFVYWV